MPDKTLIDNELFIISVFLLGTPLILAALIGKDYSNITNFLKYTVPFVILELVGIIFTICILICLILKIFHLVQYWFVRRRINRLKQKEQLIKQTRQDNLSYLRREIQNIFLEAKPLLNVENTIENKHKLEKIREKLLQSKFKDVALQDERIQYIRLIGEKIQQTENYLRSKEKETLDKKEQIKKKLKIEKGYFKKATLNDEEIQVLLENKFVEVSCRELNGIGNTLYLLKPRHDESVEHFFLVMQMFEYLKDKVNSVELHNSVEPDIIFEHSNQKFAIEVETGSTLDSKKEELLKKIETNNNIFGRNWYFVVTSKKLVPKYKSLYRLTYNRRKIGILLENLFDPCKNSCENPQKSQVQFINKMTREIP